MSAPARLAAFGLLLATFGCAQTVETPELGGLYDRLAQEHDPQRNPVIVIPGILGSKLVDDRDGRVVWGAFAGGYSDPGKPEGARLVSIPMSEGAALAERVDTVRPDGALDRLRVNFAGLPLELNAYVQILGTLGVGGYRDEPLGLAGAVDYGDDHYTCFQFDYDWRRDNIENAQRLHAFILEKRAYVQSELRARYGMENADVKFDIVAHSMGGLLTRYYLRYGDAEPPPAGETPVVTWAGAEHVERAILVGTPSAGSADSLLQLTKGIRFAFFLPRYEPAVLSTMPAIYQLLPRPRHGAVVRAGTADRVDVLDPDVWEAMGWGLLDPEQDDVLRMLLPDEPDAARRRAIARDHVEQCLRRARRFFAALDVPAAPPPGTDISLIAGDAVPTNARLEVDDEGRLWVLEKGPGDGSVLRSSALMDERIGGTWQRTLVSPVRWHRVTFLFEDHLALTQDPVFADNVLYQLLEEPR
jgi:pimeloyl-ACP methyl ester carboxylesterase